MARPTVIEAKRHELLITATTCFKTYGYNRTSLDEVARAMKLNKASLYYYIKSKEDLFATVINHEILKSIEDLIQACDVVKKPLEKLEHFYSLRVLMQVSLYKLISVSKTNWQSFEEQLSLLSQRNIDIELKYIKTVCQQEKLLKLKDKKLEELLKLLFTTLDSFTREAILYGNLLQSEAGLEIISSWS